jgi:hypothetical protein
MGKRFDPLDPNLDTPLAETKATDVRATAWYRFTVDIEELIGTGEYTWAEDTLRSIQLTVEQTQRVTDGQRQAVDNIEAGRYKSHGRRYEGFRPRWDRDR